MLSLDLFDSKFEKPLHEGAVDDAEYARLKTLGEKIDYLKQARAKTKDPEMHRAIDQRIKEYNDERHEILSVRGMKETEQRAPAKGLLKGKDLVTPQQRVAGATPQKPGMMGAVKDVAGGIKRWLKGEPDQGPTYEEEQPQRPPLKPILSPQLQSVTELIAAWDAEQDYIDLPLADGTSVPITRPAIFNALIALKQIQTNRPKKYLDYVNRNLSDKDTFFRWLANVPRYKTPPKKKKNVQPGLPMTPPPVTQQTTSDAENQPPAPSGPMVSPEFRKDIGISERKSQKKKFKSVKDVRLSRELQKARALYPTAGSDMEAFAKAQMDANDDQDTKIQTLQQKINRVSDINTQLATTVNNLNNKLQQTRVAAKPATVPTTPVPTPVTKPVVSKAEPVPAKTPTAQAEPVSAPVPEPLAVEPVIKKTGKAVAKPKKPRVKKLPAKDMGPAVQVGVDQDVPELPSPDAGFDFGTLSATQLATQAIKKAKSTSKTTTKRKSKEKEPAKIDEHGGGIGPRQHWQSMMREQEPRDASGGRMYQAKERFLVRHNGKDVAFFPDMEQAKAAAKDMMKDLRGFASVHRVMREGEMSKIDIMRQDLKLMSNVQFLRAHGMSKVAFQQRYRTLLKPAPAQDTPMEGTAQQFGQAVRMAGYTGRELEKDPAYQKSVKHARQEREQSQRNIERVKQGYGEEPEDYHDLDEMFNMPGTTVPRKSVIQGYTVFFNPETKLVSVTRGGESEEAAIEQQRIGTVNLRTFRQAAERLIDKIESEDQLINEGAKDLASATAVIACLLTGGSLTGCATAPQKTTAQQVLKTGQDVGRTVQTAKNITRAGVEAEVNQEIRNLLRGIGGRPEELNNSNILRIWRKIKGAPPVPPEPQAPEYGPAEPVKRPAQFETKEPQTKQEFDRAMDSIANQLRGETNPAVRQMLNLQLKVLQDRGRAQGWFKGIVREDTAALAAEDAILKRIFVKHRDLMMEYGPEKITQAAESVAYNVGDIAHITDDQITEWVDQVEYILGARP